MQTPRLPAFVSLCLASAVLCATGCSIAAGYRVPDGLTKHRSYTSIAGDVEVGRDATIRSARTVAGNIEVHEGGRTGNLTTVAGRVRLEARVRVEGSIKTVAGDIELGEGCTVTGDITTVVGHITMAGGEIQGGVTVENGRLEITRTRVTGTIRVKHSNRDNAETPELTIGSGAEVGALVVDEGTDVRLRIHRTAKVGSITGAEVEYFD